MAFFSHPFRVRFADVDSFRISYFSRAFEYAHAAFEELLVACELPLSDIIETERVGMPLVHAEADYVKPMRLGESLEVRTTVERLGSSSITFGHTIVDAGGAERARMRYSFGAFGWSSRKRGTG